MSAEHNSNGLNWYYEELMREPPSESLLKAFQFARPSGYALDFGCGPGRDTKAILERSYDVDALDGNPEVSAYLRRLPHQEHLRIIISSSDQFTYSRNHYALINAQRVLSLLKPAQFNYAFPRLKDALADSGILVADIWGDRATDINGNVLHFPAQGETLNLFSDMDVLDVSESVKTFVPHNKELPVTDHSFKIIARKKSK